MKKICCKELNKVLDAWDGLRSNSPGQEYGHLSISFYNTAGKSPYYLCVDDGWTGYPDLEFRFCPFCGKDLRNEN